ncbi:MFS transporter [Synechococcus sp. MIT S1220]|uniref:MFS transporter n=1 Tax=Synechococcus sp. MIT S1220 TaxID=3082549 RepID=UPI0039AED5E9
MSERSSYDYLGVLAASCALAIGIGLERSEFAVLGNSMVSSGWMKPENIGQLVGLNLAGYMVGAVHQARIQSDVASLRVNRLGLYVCIISFFVEPLIPAMGWQVLWRLISGWGCAQLVTGIPSFGVKRLQTNQKRAALGFTFAGAGLGAVIGSLLISALTSGSTIGSWFLIGGLSIVMGIPIYLLIEREMKSLRLHPQDVAEQQEAATELPPPQPNTSSEKIKWSPSLVLFAITAFFFGAGQVSILTYEPLFLTSVFKMSEADASSSYSLVVFGYMIGAIIGGLVPKKFSTDLLLQISAWVGVLGTLLFVASPAISIVTIGGILFGIWNGAYIGLLVARLGEILGPVLARKGWAIFSFVLSIGFIIVTFVSGYLAQISVPMIFYFGLALVLIHAILENITAFMLNREGH